LQELLADTSADMASGDGHAVQLDRLGKRYPNGFQALSDLTLEIANGEFMVLVGPSGCGKTTALRMVAGLEEISSGTLRIGGRVVNDVTAKDRDIAMVFQNYALYPHKTVAENIGFPLKLRGSSKADIATRVTEAAQILGLAESLGRRPGELSGGQRQRVAMGRALVREPSVFLMDEPLSNLDAKLRVQMRAEVRRIQRRLGVATLYVTHDQTEAMTMGDRVAVLRDGALLQCDRPDRLYEHPADVFVASFIGSPAMNLYEGSLSANAAGLMLGSQRIALGADVLAARPRLAQYANKRVVVGIRPEDLAPAPDHESAGLRSDVVLVESLGAELLVHFTIDARRIHVDEGADDKALAESGDFAVAGEGIARVEPRARVSAGQRIGFSINPTRLHFFDPGTEQAIVA
jgi:multiple sugar transport system ATP-binding protein